MTETIQNPKDSEKIKKQREEHWIKIEELDGQIISLPVGYMGTERKSIPDGFCVEGKLDKVIRDQILADVIPLRPISVPTMRQNADKKIDEAKVLLKTDNVLLLALHDSAEESGWSINFVSVQDLYTEDPYFLLLEHEDAFYEGNIELADCKMYAYKAVSGKI